MKDFAEPTLFFWTDLIFAEVHIEDTSRVLLLSGLPQVILMPILEICLMNWLSDTMSSVQSHFSPESTLLKIKKPKTTTNQRVCYSYYW